MKGSELSEQTYRERWRREVYRTRLVTDTVRVALLALSDDMDDDGMVSVKQKDLAELIGRRDKRTGERVRDAVAAGFIEQVSRGQRNGPGRYRATLPGASSGHPGGTKNRSVFRTPGGDQEDSLHPGFKGEENGFHQDTRGGRRSQFDPSVFRTPGGDEEPAPSKGTARARSKTADRSSTTATADADDSRRGGVVVRLFDEEIEPSLRSHTAGLRPAARANPADRFAEFWAAYPRKVAKGAARKAFEKAVKNGTDPEEIIWGARRYSTDPRRATADIRYTAHPATWINSERWTDEDEPAPQHAPATGTRRAQQALQATHELQAMIARGEIEL